MEFILDKESKSVSITRQFAAERDLVWEAWTNPEILDQWWAPAPCKSKTKSMKFMVGGRRLFAMVMPDGSENWGTQDFTAINPKESFNFLSLFTDKEGNPNTPFGPSDWSVSFDGQGDATTVSILIKRDSFEELEKVIEMGFRQGFTAALENLDILLTKKTNNEQ